MLNKKQPKLNKSEYYTKKNIHITNSKVSDFLKSKEIYKQKWVDWTYERDITPSLLLGSIVDDYISTGSLLSLTRKYHVKVLKKDDPEKYEAQQSIDPKRLVSKDIMDKAIAMGGKINESNIKYWLKFHKAKYQVLLTSIYEGCMVAGLLDALVILNDTAYIIDFKTSQASACRNEKSWYWHCKDYGYLRQMAHYGQLVKDNYPEVKNVIYRHVVISSSAEENYPVKIFELDPISLDFASELNTFKITAVRIVLEKEFKDFVPAFNDVIKLRSPYDISDADIFGEEDVS